MPEIVIVKCEDLDGMKVGVNLAHVAYVREAGPTSEVAMVNGHVLHLRVRCVDLVQVMVLQLQEN